MENILLNNSKEKVRTSSESSKDCHIEIVDSKDLSNLNENSSTTTKDISITIDGVATNKKRKEEKVSFTCYRIGDTSAKAFIIRIRPNQQIYVIKEEISKAFEPRIIPRHLKLYVPNKESIPIYTDNKYLVSNKNFREALRTNIFNMVELSKPLKRIKDTTELMYRINLRKNYENEESDLENDTNSKQKESQTSSSTSSEESLEVNNENSNNNKTYEKIMTEKYDPESIDLIVLDDDLQRSIDQIITGSTKDLYIQSQENNSRDRILLPVRASSKHSLDSNGLKRHDSKISKTIGKYEKKMYMINNKKIKVIVAVIAAFLILGILVFIWYPRGGRNNDNN